VLLITHDRALLDAVGTRTVAVEDQGLRSYLGGWAEYLRVREEREQDERTAKRAKPAAKPAPAEKPPAAAAGPPSKNQRRQAERLEKQIEQAEAAMKALEEELADPAAWSSPDRSAASTQRHDLAKRELKELYARWEEALSVARA
jgi:ATP-binding cassette subfamily F protein 3